MKQPGYETDDSVTRTFILNGPVGSFVLTLNEPIYISKFSTKRPKCVWEVALICPLGIRFGVILS